LHARLYANSVPALPYSAGSACCLRAEEVGVRITIRRGPNAESLNQLQAQITSGSLRGGQEEYVEVMRVAFRYARLKMEAKGPGNCTRLNPVGFSCDCIVHVDPYGNACIADKGDQFAD
jgi:hypothetical protein